MSFVIWIIYVTNVFLTFDFTVLSQYLSSLNFHIFTFFWCCIIIGFYIKLLHLLLNIQLKKSMFNFLLCPLFKIVVVFLQNLPVHKNSDPFPNGWEESSSCSGLRPNTFSETFLKLNENPFTETKG